MRPVQSVVIAAAMSLPVAAHAQDTFTVNVPAKSAGEEFISEIVIKADAVFSTATDAIFRVTLTQDNGAVTETETLPVSFPGALVSDTAEFTGFFTGARVVADSVTTVNTSAPFRTRYTFRLQPSHLLDPAPANTYAGGCESLAHEDLQITIEQVPQSEAPITTNQDIQRVCPSPKAAGGPPGDQCEPRPDSLPINYDFAAFQDVYPTLVNPGGAGTGPLETCRAAAEVSLVVDTSCSMGWPIDGFGGSGPIRIDEVNAARDLFLDFWTDLRAAEPVPASDRLGVVNFGTTSASQLPVQTFNDALVTTVKGLSPATIGGTSIGDGVDCSASATCDSDAQLNLAETGGALADDRAKVSLLFSDGAQNSGQKLFGIDTGPDTDRLRIASDFNPATVDVPFTNQGAFDVFTIYLGDGTEEAEFQEIATASGGQFRSIPTAGVADATVALNLKSTFTDALVSALSTFSKETLAEVDVYWVFDESSESFQPVFTRVGQIDSDPNEPVSGATCADAVAQQFCAPSGVRTVQFFATSDDDAAFEIDINAADSFPEFMYGLYDCGLGSVSDFANIGAGATDPDDGVGDVIDVAPDVVQEISIRGGNDVNCVKDGSRSPVRVKVVAEVDYLHTSLDVQEDWVAGQPGTIEATLTWNGRPPADADVVPDPVLPLADQDVSLRVLSPTEALPRLIADWGEFNARIANSNTPFFSNAPEPDSGAPDPDSKDYRSWSEAMVDEFLRACEENEEELKNYGEYGSYDPDLDQLCDELSRFWVDVPLTLDADGVYRAEFTPVVEGPHKVALLVNGFSPDAGGFTFHRQADFRADGVPDDNTIITAVADGQGNTIYTITPQYTTLDANGEPIVRSLGAMKQGQYFLDVGGTLYLARDLGNGDYEVSLTGNPMTTTLYYIPSSVPSLAKQTWLPNAADLQLVEPPIPADQLPNDERVTTVRPDNDLVPPQFEDTNGNGIEDDDDDCDGILNVDDPDDDNDGVLDELPDADEDGDGIPDFIDHAEGGELCSADVRVHTRLLQVSVFQGPNRLASTRAIPPFRALSGLDDYVVWRADDSPDFWPFVDRTWLNPLRGMGITDGNDRGFWLRTSTDGDEVHRLTLNPDEFIGASSVTVNFGLIVALARPWEGTAKVTFYDGDVEVQSTLVTGKGQHDATISTEGQVFDSITIEPVDTTFFTLDGITFGGMINQGG